MDVDPNLSVDPPSPSPKRCFELGQAIGRVLKGMPERAVIMGSSSWSHGFLTERNHFLWPDHEADRAAFEPAAGQPPDRVEGHEPHPD